MCGENLNFVYNVMSIAFYQKKQWLMVKQSLHGSRQSDFLRLAHCNSFIAIFTQIKKQHLFINVEALQFELLVLISIEKKSELVALKM